MMRDKGDEENNDWGQPLLSYNINFDRPVAELQ